MKFEDSLQDFQSAFASLQKALEVPMEDERDIAGTIKLFELLFETCWKCLKNYLAEQGIVMPSNPRQVFEKAYKAGVLNDDEGWIRILKDRNLSVHVCDKAQALALVQRIRDKHICAFQNCLDYVVHQSSRT